MNKNILKIEDISTAYEGINILKNINIELKKGEILSIVGESGSGKSTLLKSIIGIDKKLTILNGKIIFENRDLTLLSKDERREVLGKSIALIPQNPMSSFNPLRKLKVQFKEVCKSHSIKYDEKEIDFIFNKLGLKNTNRILNSHPYSMSGGMIQRIAIALALLLKPSILLCDEITSALDVVSQKSVIDEILKVNKDFNVSIIFVTHNLGVASFISNNIAFMKKGEVVEYGTPFNILKNPQNDYVKKFVKNLYKISDCKEKNTLKYEEYLKIKENILIIDNISKKYDTVQALENINIVLKKGEILGIVGESGSGKSTLLKLISRLEKIDKGEIILDNINTTKYKPQQIGEHLQIVFQDPSSSFNPFFNIKSSIDEIISNFSKKYKDREFLNLEDLVKDVEMNMDFLLKKPANLSGGQCQRLGIVRALITNPKILLCDEITSALDVISQNQVIKILKKLKDLYGLSIIFISHDLSVVANICDRIIVLKNGKVIEENFTYDLVKNPREDYTKVLVNSIYEI